MHVPSSKMACTGTPIYYQLGFSDECLVSQTFAGKLTCSDLIRPTTVTHFMGPLKRQSTLGEPYWSFPVGLACPPRHPPPPGAGRRTSAPCGVPGNNLWATEECVNTGNVVGQECKLWPRALGNQVVVSRAPPPHGLNSTGFKQT